LRQLPYTVDLIIKKEKYMASRYVRIYKGPENMNVVGFSASAAPEESDDFEGFMTSLTYSIERLDRGDEASERHIAILNKLGGVSSAYYGIEPPLREEDELKLYEWCAEHVYTSHNYGFLIDNRETKTPLQAFHDSDQRIIGSWIG
jgi:hypothetical protein